MKNKIRISIAAVLMIVSICGVFSFGQTATMMKSMTSKTVYEKITKGIKGPDLVNMTKDMFNDQYGINKKYVENYIVMAPMMNVQATEYAVFKVKSTSDISKIRLGIKKRQNYLEDTWKTYLPYQYELVKKSKVVVKGKYVLFVISQDSSKVIKAFNKTVK